MSETSNGQEPQDGQPTAMMELTEVEVRTLLANYAQGIAHMVMSGRPIADVQQNFPRLQSLAATLGALEHVRAAKEAERFVEMKRQQVIAEVEAAVLAGMSVQGKPS